MRKVLLLAIFIAACNRGPAVPTAAENRDLDSAADMLNGADDGLSAIDENGLEPAAATNSG